MRSWCPLAILVGACGHRAAAVQQAPADAGEPELACEAMPFADSVPIPEASGAVVTTLDGRAVLLVVSDSGNDGAFLFVDAETGAEVARGKLPLGTGASDDLEGISLDADGLWGLTSSGWMRRWTRDGATFTLADGPYAIGDVDESLPSLQPLAAPDVKAFACAGPTVNCGKNYEALCLGKSQGCDGWAGAKTEGRLWCLVKKNGRYAVDPTRSIAVADPTVVSDCAVDPGGDIWVASNVFDGTVWRVHDGKPAATPIPAQGSPEALALGDGGVIYRLQDTQATPSPAERWRCR